MADNEMNVILWILIVIFSLVVIIFTTGYYSIPIFIIFIGGLVWENRLEKKRLKEMEELIRKEHGIK